MRSLYIFVDFIMVCLCILFYATGIMLGMYIGYFSGKAYRESLVERLKKEKNNENNDDFWVN